MECIGRLSPVRFIRNKDEELTFGEGSEIGESQRAHAFFGAPAIDAFTRPEICSP